MHVQMHQDLNVSNSTLMIRSQWWFNTALLSVLLLVASITVSVARADEQNVHELEIGYMPILPVSQLFVGIENGWLEDSGIKARLVSFQNGPAMVQALLAGQLDVAHVGIGPAMVARAKGADIKVVASSIVEQISFIGLESLTPFFNDGDATTAFKRFEQTNGRKPVITTFPVGSVPQTVLQYWLQRKLGIDDSNIDIIYQGAAQVQQALLTGAVDGAMILEPAVSIVASRVPSAKVLASGEELFPGQPGAILAVRESLIAEHPELVQAMVDSHQKATVLLNNDPETAGVSVQKYVGGGRLKQELVVQAIHNSNKRFVADPNYILDGTREMHDFQNDIGTLKAPVNIDELFDLKFYGSVK